MFYELKGDRVWNEILAGNSDNMSNLEVCNVRKNLAEDAIKKIKEAEGTVKRHKYNFQYLKLSAEVTLHRQKRYELLTTLGIRYYKIVNSKGGKSKKIEDIKAIINNLVRLRKDLNIIIKKTKNINKSMFKPEEVEKDIFLRYDDEMQVLTYNINQLYSAIKTARNMGEIPQLLTLRLKTEVKDIEYRFYHRPKTISPYDDSWNLNL